MKLIMRADDLGISEGVNYGILSTLERGTITCVGLMTNMPKAQHGFELVKSFNISLGLHANICSGTPVSKPYKIPTLVDKNGQFYSSKVINSRQHDSISIIECEIELEAQLDKFTEITGRTPDYFEGHAVFSNNFITALHNVAKQRQLFLDMPGFDPNWEQQTGIYSLGMQPITASGGIYDPKQYFTNSLEKMKANGCSIAVFHPGFIDKFLLDNSSYTTIRTIEQDFLCSTWLQQFLSENSIELVNFNNYQLSSRSIVYYNANNQL